MGRIVREDSSLGASCKDKGKDSRREHDGYFIKNMSEKRNGYCESRLGLHDI